MNKPLALLNAIALSMEAMKGVWRLQSLDLSSSDKTYKNIRHRRGRKRRAETK